MTVLINDPFLIFEELSVLNEGLVDVGLAVGTSSAMSMTVRVAFNSDSGVSVSTGVSVRTTMNVGLSVGVGVRFSVNMGRSRVGVGVGLAVSSVGVATFADDVSLLDDFSNDGLGVGGLDDSLFVDLVTDFSVLLTSLVDVSLVHEGDVLLLNEGGVLLMDNWLMVLVDVLLNDHWLMMLMNDVLMMLMNNILLVLNNNIFVMLVDHVLMDLLNDGCIGVGSVLVSKVVSVNGLTFIGALVDSLFVVSDHNWLFVDLFNVGVAMALMVLSGDIVAAISVSVLGLALESSSVEASMMMAVVFSAVKTVGLVVALVAVTVLLLADE